MKSEGELFLAPPNGDADDVACLDALNGSRFQLATGEMTQADRTVRADLLTALNDFRDAMRSDFGSVWSDDI